MGRPILCYYEQPPILRKKSTPLDLLSILCEIFLYFQSNFVAVERRSDRINGADDTRKVEDFHKKSNRYDRAIAMISMGRIGESTVTVSKLEKLVFRTVPDPEKEVIGHLSSYGLCCIEEEKGASKSYFRTLKNDVLF